MDKSLAEFAKAHGVKYFLINFTDLSGVQRSKLVPAAAIDEMQSAGAGFAGFAAYLDMTPAYPDMFGVPDAASVVQLPWRPEVAWGQRFDDRRRAGASPPGGSETAGAGRGRRLSPENRGRGRIRCSRPMARAGPL